jgi:hypothetical protein
VVLAKAEKLIDVLIDWSMPLFLGLSLRGCIVYRLEIEIPGLPKIESNGAHGNYFAKNGNRTKWRQAVYARAWPLRPPTPLTLAKLTCIRCSSTDSDYDNLAGSFKSLVDGLKAAGIIVDDGPNVLPHRYRVYDHEYAPRGKGKVRMIVEQIEVSA